MFAKEIYLIKYIIMKNFVTLLFVRAPTTAGATKPGTEAIVFVIPTSVPICFQ